MPTGHKLARFHALVARHRQRFLHVAKQGIIGLLIVVTLVTTFSSLLSPMPAYAADPVTIEFFGQNVDQSAFNITNVNPTLVSPLNGNVGLNASNDRFSFNEVSGTLYTFNVTIVGSTNSYDIQITVQDLQVKLLSDGGLNGLRYSIKPGANQQAPTVNQTASANPLDCSSTSSGSTTGWLIGKLTGGYIPDTTLPQAICASIGYAINAVATMISVPVNFFVGWALDYATVSPYLNFNKPPNSTTVQVPWAKTLYDISLNLVNYVIVLLLIFLSFANILHINVDTYGLKKVMPTLIIGVLLANFGLLIVRFIADAADVLVVTFTGTNPGQYMYDFITKLAGGLFTAGGTAGFVTLAGAMLIAGPAGLIILLFLMLLCLIPAAIIIILCLLFWLRFYVVVLLATLSPLAFIAMSTSMTESYFKQWWTNLLKWIAMAPVAMIFLWVAVQVNVTSISFQSVVIGTALIYLAIKVPFGLGGTLSGQLGGLLKKAGAYAGKTADKSMGDVTKQVFGTRVSPMSFYHGWKQRSDEKWQEHLNQGGVEGRAINEAAGRAVSGVLTGKFLPGKGGLGKHIGEGYSTEKSRGEAILQGEMDKKLSAAVATESGTDRDTIRNEFKAAIAAKDFDAASRYLAVMASQGTAKSEDQEEFINAFKGSHAQETAMVDSLIPKFARNAELGDEVLVSRMTRNHGKFEMKKDDQYLQELERATAKSIGSKSVTQAQSQVKVLWKENFIDKDTGKEITPDQWSAKQRAMFNAFKQVSAKAVEEVPTLQRLVGNQNIQVGFGEADYQNIGDEHARGAVRKIIESNGAGEVYPKNGEAPTETHYRHAEALANDEHWKQVTQEFDKQFSKLQSKLSLTGQAGTINVSQTINAADRSRIHASGNTDAQGILGQADVLKKSLAELSTARDQFKAKALPEQAVMFEQLKPRRLSQRRSKTL